MGWFIGNGWRGRCLFFVNRDYITDTDADTVYLADISLPLSRKYKQGMKPDAGELS